MKLVIFRRDLEKFCISLRASPFVALAQQSQSLKKVLLCTTIYIKDKYFGQRKKRPVISWLGLQNSEFDGPWEGLRTLLF